MNKESGMTILEFIKKTYTCFKNRPESEHFFIQEEICAICLKIMTSKQRGKAYKLIVKHFKLKEKQNEEIN